MESLSDITPGTGPAGQQAHPDAIAHGQRLAPALYTVGDEAWCVVGNGLSNQGFVRGPDGLIAIDSGESVEEMRSALTLLRSVTDEPIVACIYTHFHYVNGTAALLEESRPGPLQVYGHAGIDGNIARFGGEIAPRSSRGLVHQFGTALPDEGEDALLHCGLGRFLRNPEHAPYTPGYIRAQHRISEPQTLTIAGLQVHITPAPSDSDDSITAWFPKLKLCVHNLIWPALFNIYAIRGEEYRDPRILLKGIDEIYDYEPEYLLGTHGPPISGEDVRPGIEDFRDAIAFIWDQTVRGANKGLTLSELVDTVKLPARFERTYLTRQFYGLVEHHVRQIHAGLFGWLDEDESHLLPLPDAERYRRMIAGFGGRDIVRQQLNDALAQEDWRWAIELGTWLTRGTTDADQTDRDGLAAAMRGAAQRTTSANVRNWCLTRALELEGAIDLSRFRTHRFSRAEVLRAPAMRYVPVLRVLLKPEAAAGMHMEMAWQFAGGMRCGLRLRDGVAIPTDGRNADRCITLSHETWADLLGAKTTLGEALADGLISSNVPDAEVLAFFSVFEHPALS